MNTKKVVDTNGHCVFCFERTDLLVGNGIDKESLSSEVWSYIFAKWNDDLSDKFLFVPVTSIKSSSNIPPMCISCCGQIDKIARIHEEIVQLRKRLEILTNQVEAVAQTVRDKVKGHRLNCEKYRQTLEGILANSGVSFSSVDIILDFLKNIYDFDEDNDDSKEEQTCSSVRMFQTGVEQDSIYNDDKDAGYDPATETKTRKRDKPSCVGAESVKAEISEDIKLEPEWNDNEDSLDDNLDSLKDLDFDLEDEQEKMKEGPKKRSRKSGRSKSQSHRVKKEEKERNQACEVCGKLILLKEMYNHMRDHVGDYAIKCPNSKCDLMFLGRWSTNYRIHMERSRTCSKAARGLKNTPQKICSICGDEFENLVLFGSHLVRHENFDKNFPCPISNCKEGFTTKQSVEYHLRSHGFRHMRKKLFQTCSLCQEKMTPEEMEVHLKEKHAITNELIRCSQCPFIFLKREDLLEHVTIRSHLNTGVSCDLCFDNHIFRNGFRLREHYFSAHNIGTKHACTWDGCSYTTFSENVLRLHILKAHEKKGIFYKCMICCDPPVEYVTEIALRSHNIKFHGGEPYKCRFCEKNFTSKGYLDDHEKKHLGLLEPDQPHQCNICGNVLSTRKIYQEHVRLVHCSERNFKCKSCNKVFKRPKSLKLHERMEHLGITFCCDTCGRSFKRPELFKQHQRIHTGERPFTCEKCGKTFRQRCTWKTHMKSHETKGDRFVPKGFSGKC